MLFRLQSSFGLYSKRQNCFVPLAILLNVLPTKYAKKPIVNRSNIDNSVIVALTRSSASSLFKFNFKERISYVWVIAQSGILASVSSGDQIDLHHPKTVFELYPSYHLG